MENGKPKRKRVSAARNREILEAIFMLGVKAGKAEQVTLQEMGVRVSASTLEAFRAGYADLTGEVCEVREKKPRRKRTVAELADPAIPSTEI